MKIEWAELDAGVVARVILAMAVDPHVCKRITAICDTFEIEEALGEIEAGADAAGALLDLKALETAWRDVLGPSEAPW